MSKDKPQNPPEKADVKARLMRAAVKLLSRKGAGEATMREISKEAGVSLGAYTRHFSGKEELARTIFIDHYAAMGRAALEAVEGVEGLRAGVFALTRCFCAAFEADPDLFSFLLLSQHEHLSAFPQEETSAPDVLRALIRSALERGELKGGGLDADMEAELLASCALGAILQPATTRAYGGLRVPLTELADRLAEAALAATGMER